MQQRQCQNIDLVVARHLFFPKMEEGTPEAHHQPPVHSAAPQVGRVLCQIHGAQPLHHAVVGPLGHLRRCHIILPTTGGTGRSGDVPDQVNPSRSLYWNILLLPLRSTILLCTWEKNLFPGCYLAPRAAWGWVWAGAGLCQVIWLLCCAPGLFAISTSRAENSAGSMSCCAVLAHNTQLDLNPRVWVVLSSTALSSICCFQNTMMAVSCLVMGPSSFYTENFDTAISFPENCTRLVATVHWIQDDLFSRQHIRDWAKTASCWLGREAGDLERETWVWGHGR